MRGWWGMGRRLALTSKGSGGTTVGSGAKPHAALPTV